MLDLALKWKLVRIGLTAVYLLVGWILFTGACAWTSLVWGVVFSVGVAGLTYSVFIEESEVARRHLLPQAYLLIVYLVLLLGTIYLASFRTAWQILSGRIIPRIVHFRTRLKSQLARVVLANSITLTPGTLTVDLYGDHLIVHWLHARTTHSHYAGRIIKSHLERWLRRIWM